MREARRVVTGTVLGYWLERGKKVAKRLDDHGVPASCEAKAIAVGDSQMTQLHFEMGTFGKILLAEQIADALDAERTGMEADDA